MAVITTACDETITTAFDPDASAPAPVSGSGSFRHKPITHFVGAAACLDPSMPQDRAFQLPAGFAQTIIGRQSDLIARHDTHSDSGRPSCAGRRR
jgi:hypothetical protein